MEGSLPKGFKCTCGKEHPFVDYVYAHWNIELTTTCDQCGTKWIVRRGLVWEDRPKRGREYGPDISQELGEDTT